MKDFYDVWQLAKKSFDGVVLLSAIEKTFKNRNTEFLAFSDLEKELVESPVHRHQVFGNSTPEQG
jgi:predicted nucleotidyltransferase component of viral defense system